MQEHPALLPFLRGESTSQRREKATEGAEKAASGRFRTDGGIRLFETLLAFRTPESSYNHLNSELWVLP
jgi:hypothetical protein